MTVMKQVWSRDENTLSLYIDNEMFFTISTDECGEGIYVMASLAERLARKAGWVLVRVDGDYEQEEVEGCR